jgi:hypothetical protein
MGKRALAEPISVSNNSYAISLQDGIVQQIGERRRSGGWALGQRFYSAR